MATLSLDNREWANSNVTVNFTFDDQEGSGIASTLYRYAKAIEDGSWSSWTSYASGSTFTFTGDGIYKLEVMSIDNAGNMSDEAVSGEYKIDKNAPTDLKIYTKKINESFIERVLNTITFGSFFKEQIEVKITADDNTSGIKQIWYQTDGVEPYIVSSTNWTKKDTSDEIAFYLNKEFKGVINATAIDNAGNTADTVYTPVVIEDIVPVLHVTPDNAAIWNSTGVTFKVNTSEIDTASGIKELRYDTDKGES